MSERDFRVRMVYHPTIHVPNLDASDEFFARVFDRPSTRLSSFMTTPPAPGHSTDHSSFTLVSDVFIDSLAPARYVTGGQQRYPDVDAPHLSTIGWLVDGVKAAYVDLRHAGVRLTTVREEPLEDAQWAGGPSPFLTSPDDAGLSYPLFETFRFPLDPRLDDGWAVAPVDRSDPLGIAGASHHTILTSRPDRAIRLTVDILGGRLLGDFRDAARGLSGPAVRLGEATFHYASAELAEPTVQGHDEYHAITWRVSDLNRVERHLTRTGVVIAGRSATTVVTDPSTSLGIPWGFTTEPFEKVTP